MSRVAVVTGANKGIGYAIVKGLCQQFDGIVYLTARNEKLGLEALEKIKAEVSKSKRCQAVVYHQLDITSQESVDHLRDHLKKEHGGLDILINNAGFAYKASATEPFGQQAEDSIAINYTGTKRVCDALFPLLKPHARVVNVSSQVGLFKNLSDQKIRERLLANNSTVDEIDGILTTFIKYAKEGTHTSHGFPNSAYGMSKVGVTALTFVQQRLFDADAREDIIVNACCPGYVDTDMTSHKGHLTIDEGALTPLYLALLPEKAPEPRGKFVYQKRIRDPVTGEPV